MKVFADMHHMDLYYSLQLLFEKRLGWELYRPIGLDWYKHGLWKVYDHIDTAKQYLSTEQAIDIPRDVHGFALPKRLRHNENYKFEDGIYYIKDPSKGQVNRGITLDKFKEMDFDILISSMPDHIPIFNRLIAEFQPTAKHIFQVGNAWGHLDGVRNILASTSPFPVPSGINVCFYHQEFSLDTFQFTASVGHRKIYSFIHYMREMELYTAHKAALPNWKFVTHGGGMDRDLCKSSDIAEQMRDMTFLWHIKPEGDGYGHVLHNSYAVGRPAIVKRSHYAGKLGERLLQDGVTCIDIEGVPVEYSAARIESIFDSGQYVDMCSNAYNRYRNVVDFDAEFTNIKHFLGRLR